MGRTCVGITGHALIQVNDAGENCIILYPGANFDNDTAYMEQVLSGFSAGDILMLQNEISNLYRLLERGRKKGMRIMLNPSPMDGALAEMDLTGISWLMLNETEGGALTGEGEPEAILRTLLSRLPGTQVILTLGKDGAMLGDGKRVLRQPCFPVKTVDTTAAGDTFTGYFAAAILENADPEDALRLASAAAAMAVSEAGAAVYIPVRERVEAFLKAGPHG